MNAQMAETRNQNLYCSHCLKTRTFSPTDRGYCCPVCAKTLVVTDPPRVGPGGHSSAALESKGSD